MLTAAYRDIYGTDSTDDIGQLQLLTSPISSTEEVLHLYSGGLVPAEIAVPSVLNAIGASKEEIEAAVQRVVAERTQKEEFARADRQRNDEDHEMAMKERKASIRAADAGGPSGNKALEKKASTDKTGPKVG